MTPAAARPFRPLCLLLVAALTGHLAVPAAADRVALPSDGSQSENYPLSLTQLKDWKVVAGQPQEAVGKGNGLRAGKAVALPPGAVIETDIAVPPLPPHQAKWNNRFGVIALDLSGAASGGQAACTLEVRDETGTLLGHATVAAGGPQAPGAGWSCDSEDVSERLDRAFDGSAGSIWHSDWHTPSKLPHHLQWNAPQNTVVGGFTYVPRNPKVNGSGMVNKWELQTSADGSAWRTVATGNFEYPQLDQSAKTVLLQKPETARAFRFVILSERQGHPEYASAAEFRFLGADGKPLPVAPPAGHVPAQNSRAWVSIAPEVIAKITPPCLDQPREGAPPPKAPADAKKLRVRVISNGPGTAVVAGVAFTRPPVKAERVMEVKGNSYGPYGPDYLASGMLGLQGQVDHGEIGVPLLAPFPDSPAAKAGIQNGDYLVAVDGQPLNPHFGHQEMGWLEDGHQAALGRAVVAALRSDAAAPRTVKLTVLRDSEPVQMALRLPEGVPLWRAGAAAEADVMKWRGPALNDPIWDAMEKDLVAYIEKNQHADGSFGQGGNTYIQTAWAGLALLQTHDPRHAERIARMADWCLKQPDLMNQWYWKVGYNGIFLAEYYLATGDARVKPWIENAAAWLPLSTHVGSRGPDNLQAPGHGPEGLPYDNKGLIAPALHALLFEALAKHAGLAMPEKDFHAQLWNYVDYSYADPARGGNGAVDYGPSGSKPSAIGGFAECWTRTGLFNAAEALRGPWPKGETAGQTMDAHSHIMYGSHAYGMPGGAWGTACLAGYAPASYEAVVRRHAWDWLLAWEPGHGLRVSMPHMGQPYMGWEDLNNPAWLMALGARRHVLHCCGGRERNWLDLSKLPARPGQLRVNVLADGHTELECWPTGAPVGCSRDGQTPKMLFTLASAADLDRGGVVLAQAFASGGAQAPVANPIGEPQWLEMPESKRNWKVLEATGWADPAESLARAALAVDGKAGTQWMTNAGKNPLPFPHHLVVDTGRERLVAGVKLERSNIGRLILSGSLDGKTWNKIGELTFKRGGQADGNRPLTTMFDLPPATARYLKLDVLATATDTDKPGDPGIYFGELSVLEPKPQAALQNGSAVFSVPKGFSAVLTSDGSQPAAGSPALTDGEAIPCPKGAVLRTRCLKDGWVGPEMFVEGK